MYRFTGLVCIFLTSVASANVAYNQNLNPTKQNGYMIVGTGIPANGFTVATGDDGSLLALKARERTTGQPLWFVDNVYYVKPGMAPNGTSPWWSFDFQFTPGKFENNEWKPSEIYTLELLVDFDPSSGTDFDIISLPLTNADPSWFTEHGDGFFTNPGGGAWSDDDVPYVYSQSWNLGFDFWTKAYNPFSPGVYDIGLKVYNSTNPEGEVWIKVVVVPAPAAAGLALVGLGLVGWVRRRIA